ncbi:hypothetical protein V3481_007252 [Fusarium oxysporum f. sp. vasinfectum]
MPRQEPVRVPIDDIRRTLEDLDRQRTQNRARGRQGASQSTVPNSLTCQRAVHRRQELVRVHPDDATLQALLEPRREPVRVPHAEILRMLDHLDRQRAEDRARRRAGETEQVERPTTPNRLYRPPQTFPSSKRHREQGALPAPPPTQLNRSPKRRRRSMGETLPTPPNTQPRLSIHIPYSIWNDSCMDYGFLLVWKLIPYVWNTRNDVIYTLPFPY